MPRNQRTLRNDGQQLATSFELEDRLYRAAEITHICDRNKFQILNVARNHNPPLGRMVDPLSTGNPTRLFTRSEVYKLLKWFDDHGRRRRNAQWRGDDA